jgi:hypothetical protein
MISRELNSGNDIFFLQGRSAFVADSIEIAQHIATRLKFFLTEWFLDETSGTAWYQVIFVKPADLLQIETVLKERILQTPGVTDLIDFKMSYNQFDTSSAPGRSLAVNFTYTDQYGTLNQNEVVING